MGGKVLKKKEKVVSVGRGERLAGKIRERIEEDLLLVSVGAD
jgi:hypothetical protein